MIHEAKVYANRVNRVLNKDEKLQREPKEEMLNTLKKMFENRKNLKERINDLMEESRMFDFDFKDQDLEKGATEKLVHEIHAHIGENVNYENFVNSISYTMGEFMQTENGDTRKPLYHEILDKQLYLEINKMAKESPVVVLYKEVARRLKEKVDFFSTWKQKILLSLERDEFDGEGGDGRLGGRNVPDRLAGVLKKLMSIEVEKRKAVSKLERLEYNLQDTDTIENLNSKFIKPNMDISGNIKMYAKKDKDKLMKLLFTLMDEKESLITLRDSDIEDMIVDKIVNDVKVDTVRSYKECLKTLPAVVYTKYLREDDNQIFTRLEYFSKKERASNESTVISLADLKDFRDSHFEKNWYDKMIHNLDLGSNYLKFSLSTKLQNLTISVNSFDILSKIFRGRDNQYFKELNQIVTLDDGSEYENLLKQIGNQKEIIQIIDECIEGISEFKEDDAIRMRPNCDAQIFNSKKDGKTLMYESWVSCFEDDSNLYDFNDRVESFFDKIFRKQQQYLEFSDYWNNDNIICIEENELKIKFFDENSKEKNEIFVKNKLEKKTMMKLKRSTWLKERHLFFKTSKEKNSLFQESLLKDQRVHPAIEDWISLVHNNTKRFLDEHLDKKVEAMIRERNIRNLKGRRDVKDFIKGLFNSYYQMLILRSRGSMVRLLGYCNMFRFIQKDMNLSYKARMEDTDKSKEILEIRRDNKRIHSIDFTFNIVEMKPNIPFYKATNPMLPNNLDSSFTNYQQKTGERKRSKSKMVFHDRLSFEDLSKSFKEAGAKDNIPYPFVTDIFGSKIMYDSSFSDYMDILNEVSKVLSFFIENELISVQTDKFNIFETEFTEELRETEICDKNLNMKISQLNNQFNYEYLVTRVLESECDFQGIKSKILKTLQDISQEYCSLDQKAKIYDFMNSVMKRRPHFDLNKIALGNQNIVDRISLNRRKVSSQNEFEISNAINTIFDSYDLEIKYLEKLFDLIDNIVKFQIKTSNSYTKIHKNHELFIKKYKEREEAFRPIASLEILIDIFTEIEAQADNTVSNFFNNDILDDKTFTHFIFDYHFKNVIERDLVLENKHEHDFLIFLNSYMNNVSSRNIQTEKLFLKLLCLTEASMSWKMLMVGKLFGDGLRPFKGVLESSPSTLTTRLDEYSLICNDKTYFAEVFIPLKGAIADDMKLRKKYDNLNKYFIMFWYITMEYDLKLNLKSMAYFCSVLKYQRLSFGQKNLGSLTNKFQDVEDFLHGRVTLMKDLLDLEKYNQSNQNKIKELLKKSMLDFRYSDQYNFRYLLFYSDSIIMNKTILPLIINANAIDFARSEIMTSKSLRKILSNKDTVVNHIYNLKKYKEALYIKSIRGLPTDLSTDDYRYFLINYKNSYIGIHKHYLSLMRKDIFINPVEIKNRILKNLESKMNEKDGKKAFAARKMGRSLEGGMNRNSSVEISHKTLKKRVLQKEEFESKFVHTLITLDAYIGKEKDDVEIKVFNRGRFSLVMNEFYRKEINFMALRLENSKLLLTMKKLNTFFSFNPSSILKLKHDSSFNLGAIKITILRALRFKNYEPEVSDMTNIKLNDSKLLEENGVINSFLEIPLNEILTKVYRNDIDSLYWNSDYKFTFESFFRPIVIFKSQCVPKKPKRDLSFYQRDKIAFGKDGEEFMDRREIDIFSKSSYAYLDKMAYRLSETMGGLEEGSFSDSHDLGLIKTKHDFRMNRRVFEPKVNAIRRKMEQEESKEMRLFSDRIESSSPCNINSTKIYSLVQQNSLVVNIFRNSFQNISFEWSPEDILGILHNSHPYFTLNNLRLRELENLLYSREEDEQVNLDDRKDLTRNTEYRNLRTFLFIIKRRELKNRSMARSIFSIFEDITERQQMITSDTNVISPLSLFLGYLSVFEKTTRKYLPNALVDIINQINAIMVFDELIETRTEEIKKDKGLMNKSIKYLKILLDMDSSNFRTLNFLAGREHPYSAFEDLKSYPYLPAEVKTKVEKFRKIWNENSIRYSTSFKILQDFVRSSAQPFSKYNLLSTDKIGSMSYLDIVYTKKWEDTLSLNMTLNQFQRTHVSKRLSYVKIEVEKVNKVSKKVADANNLWISKIFEHNRMLQVNLKHNILNNIQRLIIKLKKSKLPKFIFRKSYIFENPNLNLFNTLDHLFYSGEADRKMSIEFYEQLFKSYVSEMIVNSTDRSTKVDNEEEGEKERQESEMLEEKIADYGDRRNLNFERFSEISDYITCESGINTEKNRFLAKNFDLDVIWPEYLKKYLGGEEMINASFDQYIISRIKKLTQKKPKVEENLSLFILGYLMTTFTETWFKNHKIQSLSLLVNSIKKTFIAIIDEEAEESAKKIDRMEMRTVFSQEKDKRLLSFANLFVGEVVKKSYLLGIKFNPDQIAINSHDFYGFFMKAQNLIFDEVKDLVRKTEDVMFHSTDDIFKQICMVERQKDLVEFAMSYCQKRFTKAASSKLLSRNSKFLFELDALKRYLNYLKFDNMSLMHKVRADLTKKFLDELTDRSRTSQKMLGFFKEYKKDTSATLSKMIEGVKTEKLQMIKDKKNEILESKGNRTDAKDWIDKKMSVKVDIEKKEPIKKKRLEMVDHQYLHKALISLKINVEATKIERENMQINKVIMEREKLNLELTYLKEREDDVKSNLVDSKKLIAQLEVENNLLRGEIHSSQIERIKLLQNSNRLKNKIEELQTQKERGEVTVRTSQKNFMENLQIPDGYSLQKGYKKCLVAETTLNYSKEPIIRYMDLQTKLQNRVRISREVKKKFRKSMNSAFSHKKSKKREVEKVLKVLKEESALSRSINSANGNIY